MIYNTEQLKQVLTGKNKAFITRVAKQQEERYGNVDVFSAIVGSFDHYYLCEIEIQFGENWIDFYFNNKGEVVDTYGNGQGHRYQKSLESCATELFKKYGGKQ